MTIVSDQNQIKKIIPKSASSFYWGMNILEKSKKRAMFSIYSFCRIVDDIADSKLKKDEKIKRLNEWRNKINYLFTGNKYGKDFLTRELLFSIKKYNLHKKDFISIIKGMEMDCERKIKFPKKKELELYCDRVAGAVGCLSMNVFGVNTTGGRKYALAVGRALQLTNIIRDLKEDSLRGRCYIPWEYVSKFKLQSLTPSNIIKNPKIKNLCKILLDDARKNYDLSEKLLFNLDGKKLKAAEIMKAMYKIIYNKMCSPRWEVGEKIKLTKFEKLYIILKIFFKGKRNYSI